MENYCKRCETCYKLLDDIANLKKQLETSEKQNKIMREALCMYAEKNSWEFVTDQEGFSDWAWRGSYPNKPCLLGIEALKKIAEMEVKDER